VNPLPILTFLSLKTPVEKQPMDRTEAQHCLQAIQKPILIDGGYSQLGHLFYVATKDGLFTLDFRVYDPLLGPIGYTEEEYREIRDISTECESLAENSDLDPDEKLFLFNNGQPDIDYWAFQPHDEAPLEAYTFSIDKALVEQAFIQQALEGEIELWESMKESKVIGWAGQIASHGEG
jgi:hypothetical protein